VTATETLYQRNLPRSCDELLKLTSMAPGLTDDDLVRLQFVTALRALDDANELAARRALSQALQLDPSAEPPPFAASRLRARVDEARAQISSGPLSTAEARLAAARKAAGAREPAARALLRAVDALYSALEIEGAGAVLEQARAEKTLAGADRAQMSLRQGILTMESSADEPGARAAFQEALKEDPSARLPDFAPPKTRRIFEEMERPSPSPAAAPVAAPAAATTVGRPAANGSNGWALIWGGTGLALAAGGGVAGAVALSAYNEQTQASTDGAWASYMQHRDTAKTARNFADVLYVAGGVALGVSAYLFLSAPHEVSVGVGAGPGKASLTVGGQF
jgi:hypothetical protein